MIFNSDPRSMVIEYSVKFEYNLSYILCKLLDIDISKSKSFGNTSSSLSFDGKSNLLMDINVIDKKDKVKLQKLSEIRNQFAHNKDASDFTKCYSYLNGAKDFLFKQYGQKLDTTIDTESQNKELFQNLIKDLDKMLEKFIGAAVNKSSESHLTELDRLYIETINEFAESDDYFKSKLNEVAILYGKKVAPEIKL